MNIAFDNSYARLPDRFFVRQNPVPVRQPDLIAVNADLAAELGLDADWLASDDGLQMLSGNTPPTGSAPLAQAYAGHQFAGWVPQLGDGRAVLLGEVVDATGQRRDIQLKGSGRTPFSRSGDGRAWLGPVLREYIVSEAMHALGIPTTRALAAVATGEIVQRETALPGAVLTRVAASHIRVGTFQYFAARGDLDALTLLTDHVIERHYPGAKNALDLLEHVVLAQAELIARWMGVGFIHGVMNTDNMAVSGETIDYGPCAFMDVYDPATVFSSIDRRGRYAYGNQPEIAVWNLAQLATSLLPLIGEGQQAVDIATAAVLKFRDHFGAAYHRVFAQKLGLAELRDGDEDLIAGFLAGLTAERADFTNTFRAFAEGIIPPGLEDWHVDWQARVKGKSQEPADIMRAANPVIIPRNHQIEAVIAAALDGDFAPFERLTIALRDPFAENTSLDDLRTPPTPDQVVHQTFCGT